MKKRAKLEELKRLFEAHQKLTVKEIKAYTNQAERTIRDYLRLLLEDGLIIAIGQTNKRYYQRNYAIDENPIVAKVLQNGTEVGVISFTYAKGYQFSYSPNYKQERVPSLSNQSNSSYSLFPIFENLIPESTRRERLLLKDGKVMNPLELLLELDNTHGNFDFIPLTSLPLQTKQTQNKILIWKSVKKSILGENSFVNLLDFKIDIPLTALRGSVKSRELYSSLSGYKHKIDVNIDCNSKQIRRVKKDKREIAHYLLKPYASDERIKNTPYLALNEHLFMSFAKNELKLDVPYTAILLGENRDFYFLIKRYDRYKGYKYHQYDFAQQLNIESEDKYDITILSILEKFSEIVKDVKSREDIFKFIVYSALIKHGDLHAKNIGLIEQVNGKWTLAPLYDIISTYPYEGKNSDDFGIAYDYKNPKKRKLKFKEYIRMGEILGISASRTKTLLKDTIKRFQIYFSNYIEKTELFEKSLNYPPLLSKKLHSLYLEKNIEFDKLGVLKELGLNRADLQDKK